MASAVLMQATNRGIATNLLHSTNAAQAVQATPTSEYMQQMCCKYVLLLPKNGKIFHKCGDMQTSMGTNFGDAPNRPKPFNEHDLATQHAFAHIISTRTGCPSVFFSCGFGQVYRNEFESRRCCYYYRVIIIILLSSVGGQINNNNTIIIITHSMDGPNPPLGPVAGGG